MNREIIFRAWNPNWDEMVYSTLETVFDKREFYSFGFEVGFSHYPKEGWIIAQYTGLKDKNGKEIYEGDICNCREYECFGKVEWNNEEAGFYFCAVMEGGGFEEEHLYDYVDELEVIGNIYENPELLEVENE